MFDLVYPFLSHDILLFWYQNYLLDIILHNRLVLLDHGILPFFLFGGLFIVGRFLVHDVTQQGDIVVVRVCLFSLFMHSFWIAIPFCLLYELLCPCWFPLVGVLLKKCLYQLLWLYHVMIFTVFWNCFYIFHTSDSRSFRFLNLFNR